MVLFRTGTLVGQRLEIHFRKRLLTSISTPSLVDTTTAAAADLSKLYPLDAPGCNVTPNIANRVGINLHRRLHHPLHTLQTKIKEYWGKEFQTFDDLSPIVSTTNNFDLLLVPPDHVSRHFSDTYYLNNETVLRTHTSAHQVELLKMGLHRFLVVGDVYRRDQIDRSHYPVFHQTEGVKIFTAEELGDLSNEQQIALVQADLKQGLEGLAAHLFGPTEMRWVDAYFPFTEPSFELEIFFQGQWMEVLGCGVVQPDILSNAGRPTEKGWAFGLGLERLAMVLFQIPDIRLFWTNDDRFHSQFSAGQVVAFQPYSKYPSCYKDISFWLPPTFHVNDLNEIARGIAGDLIEEIELLDTFTHPKTNRSSHCYRIFYRSMDRNLTNEEIDKLQKEIRLMTTEKLCVELR